MPTTLHPASRPFVAPCAAPGAAVPGPASFPSRHHRPGPWLGLGLALVAALAQAQSPTPPVAPVAPVAPVGPIAPVAPTLPPGGQPHRPPAAPQPPGGEGRLYQPGAFTGVEIGGSAEVRYVQGDSDWVWIGGTDEVQRAVSVDVQGQLLRIQTQGGWRFWRPTRLQVQVSSRNLERLNVAGAADVIAPGPVKVERLRISVAGSGLTRFDQINAEQLVFAVSGAGDAQMAGQARQLSVSVAGKSEFRGEQLQARTAKVSIAGLGDVKVWVEDELQVSIAGIGHVDYWGSPRTKVSQSGPGSVTPRGARPLPVRGN